MIDFIYDIMKNLALFFIFTQIILQMLPSGKYRQYVKLILGILIIIYILSPIAKVLYGDISFSTDEFLRTYENKIKNASKQMDSLHDMQDSAVLSTYEDEVKSKINNLLIDRGMFVSSLEIGIQDDESSENYGELEFLTVKLNRQQKPEGTIEVEEIAITQIGDQTGAVSEREGEIINLLSDGLQLEKEKLRVEIGR